MWLELIAKDSASSLQSESFPHAFLRPLRKDNRSLVELLGPRRIRRKAGTGRSQLLCTGLMRSMRDLRLNVCVLLVVVNKCTSQGPQDVARAW